MPATAFRQMLIEYRGKGTADRLLRKAQTADGFNEIYLRGKEALKLSLEYVTLTHPWRRLFTEEQLKVVRKRLNDVGCDLPAETADNESTSRFAPAAPSFDDPRCAPHRTIAGCASSYANRGPASASTSASNAASTACKPGGINARIIANAVGVATVPSSSGIACCWSCDTVAAARACCCCCR
jgi:hypothetical protein